MEDSALASIFEGLRSSRSREAWTGFLRQYSPLLLETCRHATSDADHAAECFLFACEQLSQNDFRRLLRFRLEGPAGFSTWLRVVVRSICVDWYRKKFGRPRLFRSIARLSQLEGKVYSCRFEQGLSLADTLVSLRPNFPGLTMEQIAAAEEQVQRSLNSQQLWLLTTRKAQVQTLSQESSIDLIEAPAIEPVDPRPNQESLLADREQEERLWLALSKLTKQERFIIRMRFEQGLSLEEIAGLTGLGNAQRVHRRVADILDKLRKKINLRKEV